MADFHLTPTPAIPDRPVEAGSTRLAPVEVAGIHTIVLPPNNPPRLEEEFEKHVGPLPQIGRSSDAPDGALVLRPTRERAYLVGPGRSARPAATFYGLDQTGFWAAIELTGPGARQVLERNWRPDPGDGAFPKGAVTRSSIAQVPIILARRCAQTYLLLAPRSYAQSVFHTLAVSMRWVL